jgi:hypothetical protein
MTLRGLPLVLQPALGDGLAFDPFYAIPAMYPLRDFAAAGGLMSYGGRLTDNLFVVLFLCAAALPQAAQTEEALRRADVRHLAAERCRPALGTPTPLQELQ